MKKVAIFLVNSKQNLGYKKAAESVAAQYEGETVFIDVIDIFPGGIPPNAPVDTTQIEKKIHEVMMEHPSSNGYDFIFAGEPLVYGLPAILELVKKLNQPDVSWMDRGLAKKIPQSRVIYLSDKAAPLTLQMMADVEQSRLGGFGIFMPNATSLPNLGRKIQRTDIDFMAQLNPNNIRGNSLAEGSPERPIISAATAIGFLGGAFNNGTVPLDEASVDAFVDKLFEGEANPKKIVMLQHPRTCRLGTGQSQRIQDYIFAKIGEKMACQPAGTEFVYYARDLTSLGKVIKHTFANGEHRVDELTEQGVGPRLYNSCLVSVTQNPSRTAVVSSEQTTTVAEFDCLLDPQTKPEFSSKLAVVGASEGWVATGAECDAAWRKYLSGAEIVFGNGAVAAYVGRPMDAREHY